MNWLNKLLGRTEPEVAEPIQAPGGREVSDPDELRTSLTDPERANELMQEIGSAIVRSPDFADHSLESLALVVTVTDAMTSVSGF